MVATEESNRLYHIAKGLEGIVAAATQVSEVDGERGRLTLRGYDITELGGKASLEEVAYLLWHGKLPNRAELDALKAEMSKARQLPEPVIEALKTLAPHCSGMHALRMAVSMLSIGDDSVDNLALPANLVRAARLLAQMPALVAHTWRINKGLPIVHPKPEHGLAQGFLYMLEGEEPSQARVDALSAYLVSVSEHGLNASTFAGRVTISTDADMVSALTSAVCTLKGSKHGGVPGPVLQMLTEIGTPDRTEAYIRNEIQQGRRIMGFGHRIYRVRDPRAALLDDAAEKMARITGDRSLLHLTHWVERITVRVLSELKPGRDLHANVELYAALILHSVGIPSEVFTEVFAIGRTAGWTAHMLEQMSDNRLIRPNSLYVGPHGLKWAPLEQRA